MSNQVPEPQAVRNALARIEQAWRLQKAPIYHHLQPGLADDEINRITAQHGLRLPDEAREVFRWHNGSQGGEWPSDAAFGPGVWQFPPLEHLSTWYVQEWRPLVEECAAAVEPVDPGQEAWPASYFPILLAEGDSTMAVMIECSPYQPEDHAPTSFPRPVLKTSVFDRPARLALRHVSLVSLLEVWCWMLEAEHIRWDPEVAEWRRDGLLHWTTHRSAFD